MSPFTACIVQTTSLPYDKQGNLDRALRAMEAAAARGASLILFPRCSSPAISSGTSWHSWQSPTPTAPPSPSWARKPKPFPWGWSWACPWQTPAASPTTPWS